MFIKYIFVIFIQLLFSTYLINFYYLKPSLIKIMMIYFLIKKNIENEFNFSYIFLIGILTDLIFQNLLGTNILFLLILEFLLKNIFNYYNTNNFFKKNICIIISMLISYINLLFLFNIINILPLFYINFYLKIILHCIINSLLINIFVLKIKNKTKRQIY